MSAVSRCVSWLSSRITLGVLTLLLGLAVSVAPASAALVNQYAVGSGTQTASLVIDFGFVDGDAYGFTYRFDGIKTGQDLIQEIDAGGLLAADTQDFGGSLGLFVNGFALEGTAVGQTPGFGGSGGEVWSYWTSATAPTLSSAWTAAATGPTARTLTDGGYDGWTLNVSAFNNPGAATNNPPVAVPEPAAGLVLATAWLWMGSRRRAAWR